MNSCLMITRLWNNIMMRGWVFWGCIGRFWGCEVGCVGWFRGCIYWFRSLIDRFGRWMVMGLRTWFHFIFLRSKRHGSWGVHWIFYLLGYREGNLHRYGYFYMFFTYFFNNLCTLLLVWMFVHYLIISLTLFLKSLDTFFLGNIDSCWVTIGHNLCRALRHNLCPVLDFVNCLALSICNCIALLSHSGLKPRIFTLFNTLFLSCWK